jgi:DNA-binding beta-propeller fold protein YncE
MQAVNGPGDTESSPRARRRWVIPAVVLLVVAGVAAAAFLSIRFASRSGPVENLPMAQVAKWGASGGGAGELLRPRGIAVSADAVYVVDSGNARIQKFGLGGEPILSWKVSGDGKAALVEPQDVALDTDGKVLVLDSASGRVSKYDAGGNPLGLYLSPEVGLYNPRGLAVDKHGNIYVGDTGAGRVVRVDPDGRITAWGQNQPGHGDEDFWEPTGIRVDGSGDIYVADTGNQRVKKLNKQGQTVATWAVPGSPAYLALDGHGRLFVTVPDGPGVYVIAIRTGIVEPLLLSPDAPQSFKELFGVGSNGRRLYVADGDTVRVFEPRR